MTRWVKAVLLVIASVHARSTYAQTWRVDAKPFLDINSTRSDGSVAFSLAVGASRLTTGDVLVADAADARLVLFDSAGRVVSTAGRKGQGPGEFGLLTWLGRCAADSLFAWDIVTQRMTVILANGKIATQSRLPANVLAKVTPYTMTCSRSGVFAAIGWGKSGQPDAAGIARGTVPLVIFDLQGQVITKVGDVPFGESVVSNAVGFAPRPLGKRTTIALSTDRLFVGTADSASVLSYDLEGHLRDVLRLSVPRRQPTQRHKQLAVEPLIAFFPKGSQRDNMRQALLAIGTPAELPPYYAVFTDPAGRVWVQTSHAGDDVTKLEYVPRAGRASAILLPANLTVFEVGTDYVLAKYADASDEEHIAAYRLHGPPR